MDYPNLALNEVWYRFEDRLVSSGTDEFDNPLGSYVEVSLRTFQVLKHTPKGVWLSTFSGRRFVLNGSRKRYACPTSAEALKSFNARKTRQISIYAALIRNAEAAMAKAVSVARGETSRIFDL